MRRQVPKPGHFLHHCLRDRSGNEGFGGRIGPLGVLRQTELRRYSLGGRRPLRRQKIHGHDDGQGHVRPDGQLPGVQHPVSGRRHRLVQEPDPLLRVRAPGASGVRHDVPGRRRSHHEVRSLLGQQRILLRSAQRQDRALLLVPADERRHDPRVEVPPAGADRPAVGARLAVRAEGQDLRPRGNGRVPGRLALPPEVRKVHEEALRGGGGSLHIPHELDLQQGEQAEVPSAAGRVARSGPMPRQETRRHPRRGRRRFRGRVLPPGTRLRVPLPRQAQQAPVLRQPRDRQGRKVVLEEEGGVAERHRRTARPPAPDRGRRGLTRSGGDDDGRSGIANRRIGSIGSIPRRRFPLVCFSERTIDRSIGLRERSRSAFSMQDTVESCDDRPARSVGVGHRIRRTKVSKQPPRFEERRSTDLASFRLSVDASWAVPRVLQTQILTRS
mmetsp:Transcript_9202/g.22576  ORF Transcript_9202/g.22576 Transcript_9202/m.22576 type:complete len:442 (-) Transcript_9202:2070-3395(-)